MKKLILLPLFVLALASMTAHAEKKPVMTSEYPYSSPSNNFAVVMADGGIAESKTSARSLEDGFEKEQKVLKDQISELKNTVKDLQQKMDNLSRSNDDYQRKMADLDKKISDVSSKIK